jgi:hypothetical protein
MKKLKFIIIILAAVVLAAVALMVYLATAARFDTTLQFQVRDIVSRNWVWDATITLQKRTIRAYYQTDRGPQILRFTHLEPGDATLEISASGYESRSIPVVLKRGENRLEEPIEMVGLEIPSLVHFIIFENQIGGDIVSEIRPVGENGRAVLNHPCMDLWIGARMTVQMKDGLYVQEPAEEDSVRGKELFRGQIEWEWDPLPETVFRYSARIPGAGIEYHEAPFRIIDYLLVVPNPKKISKEEISSIVSDAWKNTDPQNLDDVLDNYSKEFSYYIFTSWNVRGVE